MAFKEKQMPLKAKNNAIYKTVEGVTYFKLKSEFEGDYTKHCGLLGEEIDENFYFLRGYDIESVRVDENRNLVIQRVDKDYAPLIVKIGEELGQPTFEFNREKGAIIVTYPDGNVVEIGGFLVEGKDIRIATDSTLNGNGTIFNPLKIAAVETTGTFAPADEYFDLSEGMPMPEGKGKGYRIVTKEKMDGFGCLYPFAAVNEIQKKLEEVQSQWRVPSKSDWDGLLNALECPEDRNHSAITCTWLGKVAGSGLKSINLWNKHKTLPTEISAEGQDIRGLSIYPVGITPDRNEILNDTNYDVEGFGQIAGMWTTTKNNEGNAFVKIFGYNSAKVDQDTYGEGARMSIRLVKDYVYDNYNEIETILGFPYPTELVYGIHEDLPYVKIWTKINFYSDAEVLNGIRSEEWSAVTDSDRGVKTAYFINEWNGIEWQKRPLHNGDSVVIIKHTVEAVNDYYMKIYNSKTQKYEYCLLTNEQVKDAISQGFEFTEKAYLPIISNESPDYVLVHISEEETNYHEWRIIEGELVDTAKALVEEFKEDFANVRNDIDTLSAKTEELIRFSAWTVETINEFSAATVEHIERLDSTINKEIEDRINGDKILLEAVQKEAELRKSVDDQLHNAIIAEGEQRDKSDKELLSAIQKEAEVRESIDSQLKTALDNEISIRENVDNQLHNAIIEEGEQRDKSDKELLSAIQKEAEVRESVDSQLKSALDNEISIRKSVDDQLLAAIRNEGVIRKNNDITPGDYVLSGDSSDIMVLPTYGSEVDDVKIRISDDFFNFGKF